MRAAGENFLEVHCVCTLYITPAAKHVDPVDEMSPAAKYVHENVACGETRS